LSETIRFNSNNSQPADQGGKELNQKIPKKKEEKSQASEGVQKGHGKLSTIKTVKESEKGKE